ncbi:hypothetical protein A2673_03410 [Candidatus Kaiserbacteria bacterium RIFCSPHIGHO2_01_FULL_50_13]|uniref:VWFA domain-containing protein n=1 Tax=Candidatus Kaiserbacteria bacterium RIFCSPLOWO2_01_FULL_50_24 TaxID=1798507 RepID=A0A1F6EMK0_9BACT|nr:MAG: hypothetical protein A2673_03410 [Candidatus Kaiserbacteria bacterium RIFCSPHIGHO2_01_FULL_50_13]OGG74876.1 MAG: hypothetical protein A3A34_03585 [Candidatus Kaiserbacteria bacterium RIFCSPLOWO2_01_FULL_50_24]OGG81613.1 MAG: hypothetical protein A3H74_01370 [Candidatus Kaiserbacteria bacterium RIFCSPLOWO2_02_FULL_51_13]
MFMELLGFDIVFQHWERLWAILPAVALVGALLASDFFGTRGILAKSAWLRLQTDKTRPSWKQYIRNFVALSFLVSLLFAVWAEPLWRTIVKEPVYGKVCTIFMVDVSLSMKYAHDVPPFPDRLSAAKAVLDDFAKQTTTDPELRGSYCRAIIPFAGSAFTYMSPSTSYEEFSAAIGNIDETTVGDPGSNLLWPFWEYEQIMKENPNAAADTHVVVLISDGGKGEETFKDIPHIQAIVRRMPNTVVYTVGIGSVEVTKLPNGTEIRSSVKVPLEKRDQTGAFVEYALQDPKNPKSAILYSELDERVLKMVAGADGRYIFYENRSQLLEELKQMILRHRKVEETTSHERLNPAPELFLLPAFVIAFFLFGYTRRLFALVMLPFVKRRKQST